MMVAEPRAHQGQGLGLLSHLAVIARGLGRPRDAVPPGPSFDEKARIETRSPADPGSGHSSRPDSMGVALVPLPTLGRPSAVSFPDVPFDVEAAVKAAALIQAPAALGLGAPWPFTISGARVLVAAPAYREAIAALTVRLENGFLRPNDLHQRYFALCFWPGWSALRRLPLDVPRLGTALANFVSINQLVWAAGAATEPLARRYRAFLTGRLTMVGEGAREQLFQDSLIRPERSYVLQCCPDHREGEIRGPANRLVAGGPGSGPKCVATMPPPHLGDGHYRHRAALGALRATLASHDFDRVVSYVAALAHLGDLADRRHTDLERCARAIFARDEQRELAGRLLSVVVDAGDGSDEARRALVEGLLSRLTVPSQASFQASEIQRMGG